MCFFLRVDQFDQDHSNRFLNSFLLPSFQCLGLWLHQQFNTCSLRCKASAGQDELSSEYERLLSWGAEIKLSQVGWFIYPNKGLNFVIFQSKEHSNPIFSQREWKNHIANHSLSLSQFSQNPSHLRHRHGHVGQHNEVRWWDTCWSDFRRWHRRHGWGREKLSGSLLTLLHKVLKLHSNLLLHYLPYLSPVERLEARK